MPQMHPLIALAVIVVVAVTLYYFWAYIVGFLAFIGALQVARAWQRNRHRWE